MTYKRDFDGTTDNASLVEFPVDSLNEGNEFIVAGAAGAIRELKSMRRERQAAYAAKNRRKAKALRRPDARAVADAYMAAVEGGGLERMMRAYISKLAPECDVDARSQDVITIIQNLVRVALMDKGYDGDQIRDKLESIRLPSETNR